MVTRRVFDTFGKYYWVRHTCAFVHIFSDLLPGFKRDQRTSLGSSELRYVRACATISGRFQVSLFSPFSYCTS